MAPVETQFAQLIVKVVLLIPILFLEYMLAIVSVLKKIGSSS